MTLGVPSGAPFKLEIQMLINIGDSIINMTNVAEVTFKNLTQNDGDYSPHEYNLSEATHNFACSSAAAGFL